MKVPMRFNEADGRWYIGERDLHCGDCFRLFPDRKDLPPIEVRIEHNSSGWYLLSPYGPLEPSHRFAEVEP